MSEGLEHVGGGIGRAVLEMEQLRSTALPDAADEYPVDRTRIRRADSGRVDVDGSIEPTEPETSDQVGVALAPGMIEPN